jgi:3D-(3,5/4)-trihydroxycyclohexane-1,2-dione acylhydrolase (decyclizing)
MERIDEEISGRAVCIARYGSVRKAFESGTLGQFQDISVSEGLVIGLLNQGVRKYIGVFGHGSTDLAQVLSIYEDAGLIKTYNVRNEIEGAHCAAMLKWHYNETTAVVTSIGPGALHAFAASLVPASNGIGVYFVFGDETTHDEGPNMQQIPKNEQHPFLTLVKTMGNGYTLHTPESIFSALRRGASTVFNPAFPGPFFFLLPMNIQPVIIPRCNLLEFPEKPDFPRVLTDDLKVYQDATSLVEKAAKTIIKFGGGAAHCGAEIQELSKLIDAVIVAGAKMSGVVPYGEERFMSVGGSKGSICGNYAMNEADLAIVIGARAVCQWDCSGTAWKNARSIINFNNDPFSVNHYNRSLLILGDAQQNLRKWIAYLKERGFGPANSTSDWLKKNMEKKEEWENFKRQRYNNPVLFDEVWKREVLTQPAAIKIAYDFAKERRAARYFDAGDVQANGFQILEDEDYGLTYSDTGASYMGFAASALLAAGLADNPVYTFAFSGDGSFMMNSQILYDGVQHKVNGCVIIFDNRRMGAITGLQMVQYERDYKTSDQVAIDYVALAAAIRGVKSLFGGFTSEDFKKALVQAHDHRGLSVIHLPVYFGDNELGGLGVFGSWNVGNWCETVQRQHHEIGL